MPSIGCTPNGCVPSCTGTKSGEVIPSSGAYFVLASLDITFFVARLVKMCRFFHPVLYGRHEFFPKICVFHRNFVVAFGLPLKPVPQARS
jgi:hypothetical protein